jgi:hypothetical protein
MSAIPDERRLSGAASGSEKSRLTLNEIRKPRLLANIRRARGRRSGASPPHASAAEIHRRKSAASPGALAVTAARPAFRRCDGALFVRRRRHFAIAIAPRGSGALALSRLRHENATSSLAASLRFVVAARDRTYLGGKRA